MSGPRNQHSSPDSSHRKVEEEKLEERGEEEGEEEYVIADRDVDTDLEVTGTSGGCFWIEETIKFIIKW